MADNVAVSAGTGTTIAADEVIDGTLGTVKVQYVKIMDGTLDGTAKAIVGVNGLKVDTSGVTSPISAAALPLPAGAAANTTLTTIQATVAGVVGNNTFVRDGVTGALVDFSATSPVTQSGTWTVQIGNTPNTTAIKVDGSAVTQPVSGTVSITDLSQAEYETVAAGQTDQALGATGATGDYLSGLLIIPATAAAGAVSIKDGSGSAVTVFAGGGTTALPTLAPIPVPLGIKSTGGAWKVTTGANVSAIGIGNFT